MKLKTIVFGAEGQLGSMLQNCVAERNLAVHFIFLNAKQGDILNREIIETIFVTHQPQFVINCAAYTAVDLAEKEQSLARKLNVTGVENLAELCNSHNIILIHLSTDFVFGRNYGKAIVEEAPAEPESTYGSTKLDGELAIQKTLDRHLIIRTSWLYSEYGHNFYKTMLNLAESKDEINVVGDQIGTPTYARDLANAIISIIESEPQHFGIYHYSNEGAASWYDFAVAIFEYSNLTTKVNYIRTQDYPTAAKRPKFSVLEKYKIKETFNLSIPNWRESLKSCIQRSAGSKKL